MKILLLVPPTDLKRSYGSLKDFSNPQPAIGIAYIAATLREDGHEVKVLDAYVNEFSLEDIMRFTEQFSPQILGISVLTTSAEVVYAISDSVRAAMPHIKIVMGNIHASLFADEILSGNYADFIVHGEGELTMRDLARALEDGRSGPENVNGISFRSNGAIVNTPARAYIEDLDSLPMPAWDLLPLDKYRTDPRGEVKTGAVEIQILGTRGCPNRCTFCSSRTAKSQGTRYRMRRPKLIVDEMIYMYERYGKEVFSFMDLAFPLVRDHAVELCNEIIRRGVEKKLKWFSECRVKPLDVELLKLMKKAGCARICVGIESGNDRILRLIKKDITVEDVRKAAKMAREAGLIVDGMFMLGLPGENEETVMDTVNLAIEIKVRYAIFNLFVPYPGCELYDTLKNEDKIHFDSWSDFSSYPTYSGGRPVYVPDGFTHEKMMEMQRLAMNKFYLRPAFIYDELRRFKPSHAKKYYHGLKGLFSRKVTGS